MRDGTKLVLAIAALVLAACQPTAPTAPSQPPAGQSQAASGAGPSAWDALVQAARQEGVVNLYAAASGPDFRTVAADAFQRAYPGVRVEGVFGTPSDITPRLLAERTAGRYIPDVLLGPGSSALALLKESGVIVPLQDSLLLPEVVDESAWLEQRLWWLDRAQPYTTLMFQGSVQPIVEYNTQQVSAGQITSYWDLLDPRWKGKITATDIRQEGAGFVQAIFLYKHPDLGPRFLERLFGEMDITMGSDQRQMIDWVAQGRFPIGLFLSSSQTIAAAEQGLPIAIVPGDRLKEGAPIGAGGGSINLMDRAPHPNAAKLYINWILSREGQTIWQTTTKQNSLRIDLPKDELSPFTTPGPGVRYMNASTEEYRLVGDAQASQLVGELVVKVLQK
jgi:ABC-type Fe3+ transport system substrate-binding protein